MQSKIKLSPELHNRLCEALLSCDEFESNKRLQDFIVCGDLATYHKRFLENERETKEDRVKYTIAYLFRQHLLRDERKIPALLFLLDTLYSTLIEGDSLREELEEIRNEVERELANPSPPHETDQKLQIDGFSLSHSTPMIKKDDNFLDYASLIWVIKIVSTIIEKMPTAGRKNLLRDCLPNKTIGLINLIRINFLEESVEWIAESDVLLSALCVPINQGIFEVEPQVRQVLLIALQNDPDYGPERLDEVAYFLHAYNTSPLASKLPIHVRQTYQWISDAYLNPDATIQSMFDLLNKPAKENLAPRVTDYLQVGKTLALIANPLEMTSLQVELEDLADSTHYSALYWYGDTENLLTSLQMNASSLDEVTQTLTSSIVNWLEPAEFATTNEVEQETIDTEKIPQTDRIPVMIFISYAHEDEGVLRELEEYLQPLQNQGLITYWHDGIPRFAHFEDQKQAIDKHLNAAQIILLLISSNFFASDYCYDVEMKRAMERHRQGDVRVIPIIVRPGDWTISPVAHLQPLPMNGQPITEWASRRAAFADVSAGIQRVLENLENSPEMLRQKEIQANTQPIEIFFAYDHQDESLSIELEKYLGSLVQQGLITTWSDRQIVPGDIWEQAIYMHLESASIILLFVSVDFLNSDYSHLVEAKRALERQRTGQAHVIPIIVRSVDWKNTIFGHLQPLPRDGKPITTWHNQDEAWINVVEGIRNVLEPRSSVPAAAQHVAARKPGSFPPVWNVPYRYPAFFTGRDQMVEQLFERFTPHSLSGQIPAWALTGPGGLGKTQMAVAYAYRHRDKYQFVLWANAETAGDLATSFTQMAKLLALPGIDLQHRESVLEGMQKWFTHTTNWLLVVDNADDLVMVREFLPTFASGHVLLTSRVAATGDGGIARSLELPPLSPDDGALCLLRRANYIPWTGQLRDAPLASVKAAQELSQLMGGLPLALEQAGAYIETTGRGVGGYLELYKKYRPEIQQRYYGDIHSYREAVAFTWTIARESIEIVYPAALELLYLCAFLAPDAIPYTLFPKDIRILGLTLGPIAADPLRLDLEAMTPLRKHSLIQNQADRGAGISQISIHHVLQEVLRDSMDQETLRLWAERAVRVVALALAEVEWSIMQAHVQRCLPLIEQWQMNFREADMIRQLFVE